MDLIKVIILSIVEGITEFIPVSSTGHILLFEYIMGPFEDEAFRNTFAFVIQLGAIMAVVVNYWNRIFPFTGTKEEQKDKWNMWFKILIAVIPAVFLIPFDDKIEEIFYKPIPIAIALIFYGIVLILIESKNKNKESKINNIKSITFPLALGVGVFQCLASIPGTSRSAATIIGGMLLGFNRVVAAEFSFFLAIPTMVGASLIKILKNSATLSTKEIIYILIGALIAFVVALFVIRMFMNYIKKKDFKFFGYYRIILGILVIFMSLFKN